MGAPIAPSQIAGSRVVWATFVSVSSVLVRARHGITGGLDNAWVSTGMGIQILTRYGLHNNVYSRL